VPPSPSPSPSGQTIAVSGQALRELYQNAGCCEDEDACAPSFVVTADGQLHAPTSAALGT